MAASKRSHPSRRSAIFASSDFDFSSHKNHIRRSRHMLKHLTCQTPSRFVRVAWIALPPNGDISFGLSDKTYISPGFRNRQFVWNAYNRVTAQFEVPSNTNSLDSVKNPHFTYHQPHWFHLKSDKDRAHKDEQLFAGICEVPLVLQQQDEMPWIRATTSTTKPTQISRTSVV
jgi:hypothetical protein